MLIRLINTTSLMLESPNPTPPYAILSHAWNEEEITIAEFRHQDQIQATLKISSLEKVKNFCHQAKEDGYSYAWVDTCCIDKTNPSELQASINSMFKWYRDATKCYVYLSDVHTNEIDDSRQFEVEFLTSRWFRRGWTLQELLAPYEVSFYNSKWSYIDTRRGLSNLIAQITSIPEKFLGKADFTESSVAQRMSWAASRITTEPEDLAYCLMGLFKVNMSLLYGEGLESAFKRLQLEIIAVEEDESIFAWYGNGQGSMLAPSPKYFQQSGRIRPAHRTRSYDPERPPYTMTNKGLQMEPRIINLTKQYEFFEKPSDRKKLPGLQERGPIILVLNCELEPDPGEYGVPFQRNRTIAIELTESDDLGKYHRLSESLLTSNQRFEDEIENVALVLAHQRYLNKDIFVRSPSGSPDSLSPVSDGSSSSPDEEYFHRKLIYIKEKSKGLGIEESGISIKMDYWETVRQFSPYST